MIVNVLSPILKIKTLKLLLPIQKIQFCKEMKINVKYTKQFTSNEEKLFD